MCGKEQLQRADVQLAALKHVTDENGGEKPSEWLTGDVGADDIIDGRDNEGKHQLEIQMLLRKMMALYDHVEI